MAVTRYPLNGNTTASILGSKRLDPGGSIIYTPPLAGPTGLANTAIIGPDEYLVLSSVGNDPTNPTNPTKAFGTWFDFYVYGRNAVLFGVYVADWPAYGVIGISNSGAVGLQGGIETVPTYAGMDPSARTPDGVISAVAWNRYRMIFSSVAGTKSIVQVFVGSNRHGTTPDYQFDFWDLTSVTAYSQLGSTNPSSGVSTRYSDLYMGYPGLDAYPVRSDTSGPDTVTGTVSASTTTTTAVSASSAAGGGAATVASATSTSAAVTAQQVGVSSRALTSATTTSTSISTEVLLPGTATVTLTTVTGSVVEATSIAIDARAVSSATSTSTVVAAFNPDAGYYPVQTRTHARATNSDAPDDAVKGGPAVMGTLAGEVEAISDDLVAARQEGTGYSTIRAAIAALWSAISGKETAGAAAAAQAAAVQRANHTGTQTASTISDFNTQVRTNRLDQMATPTADVALGARKITGLGAPTSDTDAVTKAYADALSPVGSSVPPGCVPADNLVWDGNRVTVSIVDGSNAVDVVGGWLRGAGFSPSDVGKAIHIDQGWEFTHTGNPSGDGWIRATITAYVSPTRVIMSRIANRTTNEAVAIMGTDNDAAMSAHLAALTSGQRLYVEAPGVTIVNEQSDRFCFLPVGNHTISNYGGGIIGPEGVARTLYPMFITTHRTNNVFKVGAAYQQYRNLSVRHGALWSLGDHWLDAGSTSPTYGYKPSHPIAGAGFFQDYPGYVWFETRWRYVEVGGMWDGIKMVSGTGCLLEDCWLYQNVHTCLEAENPWNPDHIGLTVRRLTHGGDHAAYTGQPGHGVHVKSFGGLILRDCTAWGGRFAYLLETSGLSTLVDITNCDVDDFGDAAHSPSGSAVDTSARLSAIAGTNVSGGGIIFVANNGSAASAIGVLGCYIGTVWNAGVAPVQFLREGSGYLWNVNVAHIKSNYTLSGCSVRVHNLGAVQNLSVVGCSGGRTSGSQVLAPVGFTWYEAG